MAAALARLKLVLYFDKLIYLSSKGVGLGVNVGMAGEATTYV